MTEGTPDGQRVRAPAGKNSFSEVKPLLRGLLESVVLLLLIRTMEVIFFHEGYFTTLVQHPFWLVVLLASLQHGLFVGVATAGLSALLMDWPARPLGVDITAHYMTTAILPLQWLVVALCIGGFRHSQILAEHTLRSERDELMAMNDDLAMEVLRLDKALGGFELEAVTGPPEQARPEDLLPAIAALRDSKPDDLRAQFDEVVALSTQLQARLFLQTDGEDLIDDSGAPPLPGLDRLLRRDDPLVSTVRLARRAVVIPVTNRDDNPRGIMVICGIQSNGGRSMVGIVVFAANDQDEVEGAVPLAEILTNAIGFALSRASDQEVAMEPISVKRALNG